MNATGLVSALLLTTHGVALTLGQLHHTLQDSLDYLERKQTPMSTSALRLRTRDGVRAAVDSLSNGHPVTRIDSGREPVWRIAPEHEHTAAFYRNSVIHAFLETVIVNWRWRMPDTPTVIGWRRSGTRHCGCATC